MPAKVLVVWHSRTGGSRQMALAVARGARGQGALVVMRSAARCRADEVLVADALALVAPENLAALSGAMKDFLDRIYYALLDRRPGLPYAALVCAGSDGAGAHRQFARIAQGLRWKPACQPLIVNTAAQTAEQILAPKTLSAADLGRCAEVGATLAAGVAMGLF